MLPTRMQLQREPWTSCLETWGVPLCLHPEPALSSLGQGDGCGVPRRRLTTQLRGPLNEKEPGHLGSSEPTVVWGKAGEEGRSASILKDEGSWDLESGEIWGHHQRDLGEQGLWKLTWEFLAQLCRQWKSLTKCKKILFEQDGLISTQFSVPPQGVLTLPWVCQLSDALLQGPQVRSCGANWTLPGTQLPSSCQPLGGPASSALASACFPPTPLSFPYCHLACRVAAIISGCFSLPGDFFPPAASLPFRLRGLPKAQLS